MDWEYIGIKTGRFFLALLEYTFKGLALLAAGISLGTVSGFEQKFSAGFTSLTSAIRDVFEVPAELSQQASIINDYNSISASFSTEAYTTYSTPNVDTVFAYFGGVLDYFSRVGDSLSGHFFASVSSAVLLFGIFYLLAWVLRFARQKGQGSWKVQLERKLAKKVFKVPEELAQVPKPQPTPEPQPKPKPSKFKRQVKINTNGVGMKLNGNKDKDKSNPEVEEKSEFEIESSSKLKAVPRTNGSGEIAKSKNGESVKKEEKKTNSTSPAPPPNRDEPDWLTNARTSTKEYMQAKAE